MCQKSGRRFSAPRRAQSRSSAAPRSRRRQARTGGSGLASSAAWPALARRAQRSGGEEGAAARLQGRWGPTGG
eukprot:scaffold26773_cov125-Isochrysis_galbana.AAC.2